MFSASFKLFELIKLNIVKLTRIDVLTGAVGTLNVRDARAGSQKDEARSQSADFCDIHDLFLFSTDNISRGRVLWQCSQLSTSA